MALTRALRTTAYHLLGPKFRKQATEAAGYQDQYSLLGKFFVTGIADRLNLSANSNLVAFCMDLSLPFMLIALHEMTVNNYTLIRNAVWTLRHGEASVFMLISFFVDRRACWFWTLEYASKHFRPRQ